MAWSSALHPRAAAGSPAGGQFAAGGSQQQQKPPAKGKTPKKPPTVKTKGKLTFAQQKSLRTQAAAGKITLTAAQKKQLHAAHMAHVQHVNAVNARAKAAAMVKPTAAKTGAARTTAKGTKTPGSGAQHGAFF